MSTASIPCDIAAAELAKVAGRGGAIDPSCVSSLLPALESTDRAYDLQRQVQARLGRRIGYKVALSSKPAQDRFGVTEPVYGALVEGMLLKDGAELSLNYPNLYVEADLVVQVGSEKINDAHTIGDIAHNLSELVVFIEVPQILTAPAGVDPGAYFVATGAGAHRGVLGQRIAMDGSAAMLDRLSRMEVVLRGPDGIPVSSSVGRDLMGHPLAPALFLIRKLKSSGERLHTGDYLSLGTFGAGPVPAKPGSYVLTYRGLAPEPLSATVRFR